MEKVKTLFIGTSNFAVPILESLYHANFLEIVGIVTQPDRPVGRHQEMKAPEVKEYSIKILEVTCPIFQPEKIKVDAEKILQETEPDLIIVASYGQMLPSSILNYPKYKCLNVHGSILPELRGAVPIQMAILKGFETTGISIPIMGEGLDDGPVIANAEIKIGDEWTSADLTHWLSELAAKKLIEILPDWINGEIKPVVQNEEKASYCYMKDVAKEKAEITFDKSAEEIDRMIRAFSTWPIAWLNYKVNGEDKRIKIYRSKLVKVNLDSVQVVGRFFRYEKRLFLKCRDMSIEIITIQIEGKKIGTGEDHFFLTEKL